MGLLLDTLLLTKADFSDFRDMSKNLKDERINTFIREAQVREMRSFLGDELYLKLILDYDEVTDTFSEQRFTDLFFGADYQYSNKTIRFNGYKSAVIMYAYARMLRHQQTNVTRYGVKQLESEFSEDETRAKIQSEIVDSNAMAKVYEADGRKFLNENHATYPEWEYEVTKTNRTGFKFIKL